MHASIAAHSFGVRLLTQFVRLPVPSIAQLDAARSYATDYEAKTVKDMLRVPVWKQQADRLNRAMGTDYNQGGDSDWKENQQAQQPGSGPSNAQQAQSAANNYGTMSTKLQNTQPQFGGGPGGGSGGGDVLDSNGDDYDPLGASAMLEHVKLYRQLQANWQSYDAYARVSMAMGTNQLLHALTYYVLAYLIMEAKAPTAAYGCAAIFTTTSILLARLDLYLHKKVSSFRGEQGRLIYGHCDK